MSTSGAFEIFALGDISVLQPAVLTVKKLTAGIYCPLVQGGPVSGQQ
jgi:hypothetical protein